MKVQDYYLEAIKGDHMHLVNLIEMLIKDKKTVKLSDDESVMELYFKPNNLDRMNKLLKEYMQQKEG